MINTPDYSLPPQPSFQRNTGASLPPMRRRRSKVTKSVISFAGLMLMLAATIGGFKAIQYTQDLRSKAGLSNAEPIQITFEQSSLTALTNDTITVNIVVNTAGHALSGVEYKLAFDPSALRYQGYQTGALNRLIAVEAADGLISVSQTLNCTPQCDPPFSGASTLGSVTFVLLRPDTTIELSNIGIATAIGKTQNLFTRGEIVSLSIGSSGNLGGNNPPPLQTPVPTNLSPTPLTTIEPSKAPTITIIPSLTPSAPTPTPEKIIRTR